MELSPEGAIADDTFAADHRIWVQLLGGGTGVPSVSASATTAAGGSAAFMTGAASGDLDPQWAARLEQRLLAGVREMLRPEEGSDGTSEATPGDYEAAGRAHLLSIFEDTFGLRVVYNASPHRLRVDIERTQLIDSLEWDFRVPVMWSGTPARSHKSNDLVIFPDMDSYMRPPMPARAHRLTPTKVPGATEDTSSDFMAIFEITVVTTWAKSSQSGWSSGLW